MQPEDWLLRRIWGLTEMTEECVVTPCSSETARRFGETCGHHYHGGRVSQARNRQKQAYSSTLKKEALSLLHGATS
jgi:hypothetical protein